MKIRAVAWVLGLGLLVAACGGDGGGSTGTPDAGRTATGSPLAEPGEGSLLLSMLNEIVERDIESGATKTILSAAEPNAFFLDPVTSPDGTRIAYVLQPPPSVIDGNFDGGSDLWLVNRDGSDARPLLEHTQPNQLIRFPRWDGPDSVLAIVQEIRAEDGITRVAYTLQRVDVASGERERILEDVLAFDVSPDGERLVYAKLQPETGETLAGVNIDGSDASEVVGRDQLLAPFGYPRFSPDGGTVAFASADQTGASTGGLDFVSLRDADGRLTREATAALADGLPQDIWTVQADGGTAIRVADLKEDLPSLTWDGSGERIYAIGVSGLYDIDLATGSVAVIGEGAYHAQISWAPDVAE